MQLYRQLSDARLADVLRCQGEVMQYTYDCHGDFTKCEIEVGWGSSSFGERHQSVCSRQPGSAECRCTGPSERGHRLGKQHAPSSQLTKGCS